ncbi:hypothetical protein PM8797T_21193 [Gimesia maris DSM 8797]|nr:hypothetical protein PM8797T_21193 [Gimesia maris DSM 8797]
MIVCRQCSADCCNESAGRRNPGSAIGSNSHGFNRRQ